MKCVYRAQPRSQAIPVVDHLQYANTWGGGGGGGGGLRDLVMWNDVRWTEGRHTKPCNINIYTLQQFHVTSLLPKPFHPVFSFAALAALVLQATNTGVNGLMEIYISTIQVV